MLLAPKGFVVLHLFATLRVVLHRIPRGVACCHATTIRARRLRVAAYSFGRWRESNKPCSHALGGSCGLVPARPWIATHRRVERALRVGTGCCRRGRATASKHALVRSQACPEALLIQLSTDQVPRSASERRRRRRRRRRRERVCGARH